MEKFIHSVLIIISIIIEIHVADSDENISSRLLSLEKRLESEQNARRHMEGKLESFQEKLETCELQTERMHKKVASQETKLTNLIQMFDDKTGLHGITNTLNRTMMTSSRVKRQDIPEAVAFTAYIDHDVQHIGIEQILPYNKVVSNIGGSFNVNTHTFTSPVTGIYLFSYVVSQLGMTEIDIKLVVDGKNTVDAIADPVTAAHDQQAVNIAVLQVNKGQSVYVVNYYHSDVNIRSDELYRFSSFSGVLIQSL